MAKKSVQYFPHDYNARNDPKLQELLAEYGIEAIGVYWCIVEMLYEQDGYLPIKTCKSIAFALHVDTDVVQGIINNFGLFESDTENFWSNSILARLKERENVSNSKKAAALKRWQPNEKSIDNANAMQMQCTSNAIKIKEKENKIKNKVVVKEKEKKENCEDDHHDHHFLFSVVFNLFNQHFSKQASSEDKADCKAINRIAEVVGTEERCKILFDYLVAEKKYFKFHVGAFANMAGEKMDEALVKLAVREQEKENNQKRLFQEKQQKEQEEQRGVELQARYVRALEIGEVLTKGVGDYEKIEFGKRRQIQLELAERMPYEKNGENIIKMYYSLFVAN